MFIFKPTTKTYSDPVSATFVPGLPFGREKSKGDICLLHEGFAASKIFLNSSVLREAILNSKDYLEEVLHLKITDKLGKEPKKIESDAVEMYEPVGEEVTPTAEVIKETVVEEENLEPIAEDVEAPKEEAEVTEEPKEEVVEPKKKTTKK